MKTLKSMFAISAMLVGTAFLLENADGQSRSAQRPDPPGTIDGAKNPELIPDDFAYQMLFVSLVEPANPNEIQIARQQAKLAALHLSSEDSASLLKAVAEFRDRMNDLDAEVARIHKVTRIPLAGSADWRRLTQIQRQKDAVIVEIPAKFQAGLSADGKATFNSSLTEVKHHIKRIPAAQMKSY